MGQKILTIAVCTLLLAGFTVSPAPCEENIAADNAAVGGIETLIELLRTKGVISAGEAAGFVQRVKEAAPSRAEKVPMSGEDLKEMIESLRKQGVLGNDEALGLASRVGATQGPGGDGTKPVLSGGKEIPPVPTTVPPVYVRAMIDILRAQEVLDAAEADALHRRFAGKVADEERARMTEAAMSSIESQVELLRARGILKPEDSAGVLKTLKEAVPSAKGNGAPQTSGAGGPAEPEAKFPPVEKVPMSGEDLKGMIESLRKQGIVGGEEAEGLVRRVGTPEDPGVETARKRPVISGEKEIPYLRTAQPAVYIKTMIGILRVQEVLGPEEADILLRRHAKKAPADRIAEGIVRELRPEIRQDVRESLKSDVKAEVAQEAKTRPVPEWTKRIRIGGDLRLRYDGDFMGSGNADLLRPDQPTQVLNTHENRHRLRIRARLNMNARVTDDVDMGLRLATGTPTDPVSTNQTLGDYQNKKSFVLDQAFVRWKPTGAVTIWGGRMSNPWFSTDLVWDPDINFDGVAGTYTRRIGPALGGFLTLGAFSLQEVEFSQRDKWLFGGQAGADYVPRKELSARLGVAFYAYLNIVGKPNDPTIPGQQDFTSPLFQQKGNTLFDIDPSGAIKTALASGFQELNVTGTFDVGFRDPVHFVFLADYVKNLGFDKDDVARRTGNPEITNETTGYQLGLAVGYPAVGKSGDWKGYLFYKHLEGDAVVDAFADSDFHLGGTNAEGFVLGGEYGLARNVWLSAKWLSANEISGPPLSIDVLLVDLNVRF